jgi:hypothetical protein
VIKRLTKETKRLASDLAQLSLQHRGKSDALAQLQRDHETQSKALRGAEAELEERTREFAALARTLESLLHLRLRGGVAGGARPGLQAAQQSLYDPAVARTIQQLSAPIMQALFQHRGDLAETMMRATASVGAGAGVKAAGPVPDGTMVGLRLGLGAGGDAEAKDDHNAATATVRRRSVVLDAAPRGLDGPQRDGGSARSHHSASSAADAESSVGQWRGIAAWFEAAVDAAAVSSRRD